MLAGLLGLGHHQLRLVDRYRSRRDPHQRRSVPLPPEVADVDQPVRRGDDDLRRHLRAPVSRAFTSAGAWFAYYMFPFPNQMTHLAELQEPARLGLVRGQHLFRRCRLLFWYVGLIPGFREPSRPREERRCAARSRTALLLSAGAGLTAHWQTLRACVPDPRRALDAPRSLGALGRFSFDFATSVIPGWHTTIFPPVLRRRRRLQRLRDGHDARARLPAPIYGDRRASSRSSTSS